MGERNFKKKEKGKDREREREREREERERESKRLRTREKKEKLGKTEVEEELVTQYCHGLKASICRKYQKSGK